MIEGIGDSRSVLAYYPESHDFGFKYTGEVDNTTFEIWNGCECGTLIYELTWDCSWVDVYPTSGASIGEHDTIYVDINTTGLLPGPQICEILILTNGGNGVFTVIVNNIIPTFHVGGDGPGNYTLIQDAIDNASNHDTIYVYDDSSPYYENVIIDKTINLIGEDKNTTIIDGSEAGDVVYISANNVVIMWFTIQNSGNYHAGINIKSDHNIINENSITNNGYGIYLEDCNDNIISNNDICFQTDTGIKAKYTIESTISGNNVSSNEGLGISFEFSVNYNIISDNIISSNMEENIGVTFQSNYNTIFNNLISSSDSGGIDIYQQSCNNNISNNHISSHNSQGISIRDSSNDNIIYHNNVINNLQNAYDECTNNWDNGYPSGGNYWSDYSGLDTDGDGIGDTAYEIPGDSNQDIYPLIFKYGENPPFANFSYSVDDLSVLFNGSSSYDRDGEIITYAWDFGDGHTGSGMIVGHSYSDGGTYNVTLNITDDNNLKDNISQNVNVADVNPPVIYNFQAIPSVQSPGGHVNISATVRDSDELADVCLIIIYPDYTEENISILDNRTEATYYCNRTYYMIGLYFCQIWAVDISGNYANSNLINFEITEEFMADAGGPYFGYEETPLEFHGYAVNGFPPYSWHWDFGNGETSIEQNPIYTYENAGNYTVILTVTDDKGNTTEDTTWALIEDINHPPDKPTIRGPTSGKPGVEYTYCINAIDPDGDNLHIKWNWDDGETTPWLGPYESGVETCEKHTWMEKGTYIIRVTLRDEYGATATATLEVTFPRNKAIKTPFLKFLQSYPNLFPILQLLLQRLGLQ
jgi:parallel beta-helix repeat protein